MKRSLHKPIDVVVDRGGEVEFEKLRVFGRVYTALVHAGLGVFIPQTFSTI
jgi:hypothetical protein